MLILLLIISASCISRRKNSILQKEKGNVIEDTTVSQYPAKAPKHILEPGDQLSINFIDLVPSTYSMNYTEKKEGNSSGTRSENQSSQNGFLIEDDSTIFVPFIGKILVAGLNIKQADNIISEKIKVYYPTTYAKVTLNNFNVTILGEVTKPGKYYINNDKVSLFEVLSLCGDFAKYAKRDNITLVRTENGKIRVYNLDIRSREFLSSPFFYLHSNDIIYVQALKVKYLIDNFTIVSIFTGLMSIIFSLVSISLIIRNSRR